MRTECIDEVQKAIGRQITKAEARGIEDRVVGAMTRLARKDLTAWRQMPKAERARQAADLAGQDLLKESELKERRVALQLEAIERHLPAVENAGEKGFKVIQRKLDQVDIKIKGLSKEYMTQALDAVDLATKTRPGSLRWLSMMEDPRQTLAFVREIFGADSGNPAAKAASKAWLETVENMRVRFNEAGGDVRKLMYGYLPQPHDASSIRNAGITQWVTDVLPMLDRSRYVTPGGNVMSDAELGKAMEQAWKNLSSDGWASIEPGQYRGEGSLANAGSQARVIHFATPEAYVQYLGKYGAGSVWGALQGHIGWMAKNIGMVEELGPNPTTTFRTMHDTAMKARAKDRVGLWMTTDDMWKTLTGELSNPVSQEKHRFHQGIRNVEVTGKLQGATISAITDIPNYLVTLGYNRLPIFEGMTNLVRSFGSDAKHFADVSGMIADSQIGDMRVWADGNMGQGWTTRLANATMKVSLMNAWTDGVRRAYSVTMMAGMARMSKTPWEALDKLDRAHLERKGWTPDEWGVVQKATLEEWKGKPMLTPASIMAVEGLEANAKQRAVSRLLGTIVDEAEFASPTGNLATRTLQQGGMRAGTTNGELWRHVMLFKGFPFAMILRHWDRILNGDMTPAGRVAYSSTFLLGGAIFGALALHLKDLRDGKDPRPMDSVKFWSAAMAQGGGLSFIGDLLLNGQGSHGQSQASGAIGSLAGPVAGATSELLFDLGFENLQEAAAGEETHIGAESFRWLRSHTPFVNLWYSKLVLDRAVLDELQEFLSPGYTAKLRRRAERDWGNTWWWEKTGDDFELPDRGPSLQGVTGDF
jgi:hypothetical protein